MFPTCTCMDVVSWLKALPPPLHPIVLNNGVVRRVVQHVRLLAGLIIMGNRNQAQGMRLKTDLTLSALARIFLLDMRAIFAQNRASGACAMHLRKASR